MQPASLRLQYGRVPAWLASLLAKPVCAPEMPAMTDTIETPQPDAEPAQAKPAPMPKEIGGPKGPEPTRYGDWEVKGRCTDF